MMDRAHFSLLLAFARQPNHPDVRLRATELLTVKDAAAWDGGPADFELREIVLKTAWNVLGKTGRAQLVWARALQGLLIAADNEPEPTVHALKTPDASWTKPRPDQGGD